MNIGGYLRVFRERWVTIVICLFLGLNAAIAVTALTTPRYQASALLFLRVDSDTGTLYDRSQFSVQRVQSYPDLVDSPDVLLPVISDLKLHTTPQQLAGSISATNPVDTVSVRVVAQASGASLAADLANSVAKHLAEEVGKLESLQRSASSSIELVVTVPAQTPAAPQSPNAMINLALGLVGGLATGLVAAILMALLSRTVRTADDIHRATQLPLVAQLPAGSRGWGRAAHGDASNAEVEAYADAIVGLQRHTSGQLLELLVLVPAAAGDPTDTLRLGLARAAAESGRSVCLVEADSRSNVSLPYPPEDTPVGLSQVLAGTVRLKKALIRPPAERFAILPAGVTDSAKPARIAGPAVTALIDNLRSAYDLVIAQATMRSRPLEVSMLAPSADAVVVVAEFGATRSDDLGRRVARLEAAGVQPIGVMLVSVPRWGRVTVPESGQPAGYADTTTSGTIRTVATLARPARG